jgi:hypothetical protein
MERPSEFEGTNILWGINEHLSGRGGVGQEERQT